MSLHGQVAVVTGVAGSLGAACTHALLDAGATVIALHRNDTTWQRLGAPWQEHPKLEAMECELLDPTALARVSEHLRQKYGHLHVLVNCAGKFRAAKLSEASDEDWDFLMNANARTVFHTCRAFWPLLAVQGGRIINIGARSALAGDANKGIYAASKAAVVRLTEALAEEGRPFHIQANVILPSVIENARNREDPSLSKLPLLSASAVARLVLFLADPLSSDISGAAIPIYGEM